MHSGMIFSMEEFSLQNGPGIRTTVFLKGCPLRCVWCHSPDGQSFQEEMIRSPNGCLGCGACTKKGLEICGKPVLVAESAEVCPQNLIRQCGTRYTSHELVTKLLKSENILRTHGGVTFSGGEPLAQADFLDECLRLLDGRLHRAIQTSGFAAPERFSKVLKNCDYVLYDLKLMDDRLHQRYCGQSNQTILKNYQTLAASGIHFITRIPLIPTVTDTRENLDETARFLRDNRVNRVELLPYHALTGSKYAMVGRTYRPPFDESQKPQLHLDIFQAYQIEVKIL